MLPFYAFRPCGSKEFVGFARAGKSGLRQDRAATTIIPVQRGTEVGVRTMDQNAIRKLVLESAVERQGRKILSCARAFEIHCQHDIPLADIGRICDENGIKIRACQLGCFK